MKITREWAMPNKNTFSIKPITELINRYNSHDLYSIDPFANQNRLATKTNDLDPQFDTDHHLEATDFLDMFNSESVDLVFFDPPYSPTQVVQCYKKLGRTVDTTSTSMSYWGNLKDEVARVVKVGGVVISCGWNTNGIGKKRGFEIIEILLVAHGGGRHDTNITVDKKLQQTLERRFC
jgi:hypothetical protein